MHPKFDHEQVNLNILRDRAYNFRWAEQDAGVIPLTAADPDFPVAPEITMAVANYAKEGYFSYSPAEGLPLFREATADWYARRFNAAVHPDRVFPTGSAAHGLYTAMRTLLEPGDHVMIPNPVDFLFRKSVEQTHAYVSSLDFCLGNGSIDFELLNAHLEPRTKAIMICNPNNPRGTVFNITSLTHLINWAAERNIWIIADEIWLDIVYDQQPISLLNNALPSYNKILVVSGLSKNFGLAGLRLGYIIYKQPVLQQQILKASGHQSTAFGCTTISQIAGMAAFLHSEYWLQAFLSHLHQMRNLVYDRLADLSFLQESRSPATYLAFAKIDDHIGSNAEEIVKVILEKAKVSLVPGGQHWFESQSEGYIRICYATSARLINEAFDRIKDKETEILATLTD